MLIWHNFDVTEDPVGLYQLDSIKSEAIFNMLVDVIRRLGLNFSQNRGQCYDGASAMSGEISGVATRIQEIERRSLFIHCNAHIVNLVCCDCINGCKCLRDALELANEITESP